MKEKEKYVVIGTTKESDIQRVKKLGEKVGLDIRPFFLSPYVNHEVFSPDLNSYRIGISNILNDGFSGLVWANGSENDKMSSSELEFWIYMEMLAKKTRKRVLREWELRNPEMIDFDSLKNPSPELQEKMSNITRTFQDSVQNAMKWRINDDDIKRCLNSLYGFKSENGDIEHDKFPDVYNIEDVFPGPMPITVNIDISIGRGRDIRGD